MVSRAGDIERLRCCREDMTLRSAGCHFAVKRAIPFAFLVACIDSQPPVLSVRPLSEAPHRGAVSVPLFVEPDAQVTVRIDDAPPQPLSGTTWHLDTAALADGTHALSIEAADVAGNTSTLSLSLTTDNTAPILTLAPTSGVQGQTMGLVLTSDEPVAAVHATFLGRQRPLYPPRRRALPCAGRHRHHPGSGSISPSPCLQQTPPETPPRPPSR